MGSENGVVDYLARVPLFARCDATVTALTPMELVVMTGWDLEEALVEAPSMTRSLLAGMARRMRELMREAT